MNPLAHKRIVVTRPEAQSAALIEALRQAGAIPIVFPTIEIAPLDDSTALDEALRNLGRYDWVIFTSVNGVGQVAARMASLGLSMSDFDNCDVAAIGPATADALHRYDVALSLRPDEYISEAILAAVLALGDVRGLRFLLPRADIARAVLREQLLAHGALVDEIPVYRTIRGQPNEAAYQAVRAGVDLITFTSSSTVRYFFDLLGSEALKISHNAQIACIGPVTAATARELGLTVHIVAEDYTVPGLLQAMMQHS